MFRATIGGCKTTIFQCLGICFGYVHDAKMFWCWWHINQRWTCPKMGTSNQVEVLLLNHFSKPWPFLHYLVYVQLGAIPRFPMRHAEVLKGGHVFGDDSGVVLSVSLLSLLLL
jgi:hypothetical protein